MEKSAVEEFCKHWLAAWTGNQPDQLINFYADDIYYQDPAKPNGIKGKPDLHNYFKKLLAKYPDWVWRVVEIFLFDNGFILKWVARTSVNQEAEKFYGLDIVELRENKIIRNEVFFDPKFLVEPLKK